LLSYRHSFHAGNFADVLKHIVVAETLAYLAIKDKPFAYIDTHAGAGVYSLASEQARKTGEYHNGVARLNRSDWPELVPYFSVIDKYNRAGALNQYPGSPAFALHYLRAQDRAWLFELHGSDYPLLRKLVGKHKRVTVENSDGLAGLQALVPPISRRALILVDPSYEVKTEYQQVVDAVIAAHRKFATGVYAIWYPVVDRRQADWLEQKFRKSAIGNIQVFELGIKADSEAHGMTSSCMLVINPPWQLKDKMTELLPRLATALDESGEAFSRVEVLSPE